HTNAKDLHMMNPDAATSAPRERLLSLLLEVDRNRRNISRSITPRGEDSERPIPLSYAQERLWFLDQMGLVGTAYNVPLALRLSGALAHEALERSFSEIVRRHEGLRTRFCVQDGVPYQVVDPPKDIKFRRMDLSHVADPERRKKRLS